jgi:polyferredoxin
MAVDLLRHPIVGPILRWSRLRLVLQLTLLAAAAVIVLHGLYGPQVSPRNLATVTTAIHWRGLLIVALLAVGNLFCTACPMVLTRDVGRRFMTPRFTWPQRLRRKWIALALLVTVLFSYELWAMWESPWTTAWMIVGYFGLALVVDLTFKGASFCKYVCPVGQFNFVSSTVSPTELQVREPGVCRTCRTSDCIKGRYSAAPRRLEQRGCELGLFLPAKVGNLDCTLCLDCVQACPHDNIALTTRVPALEWLAPQRRSVFGRIGQRTDVAALAAVFTCAALLSAFTMTAPAHAVRHWLGSVTGMHREGETLAFLFIAGLVVVPAALGGAAAVATKFLGHARESLVAIGRQFAFALVPLGFGVWAAHYAFHLLTGFLTIVPVAQSAAIDALGRATLGEPSWQLIGMGSGAVLPLQIGLVVFGTAGSLGLARAMTARLSPSRSGRAALPVMALVILLASLSMWILGQPMDMRGVANAG